MTALETPCKCGSRSLQRSRIDATLLSDMPASTLTRPALGSCAPGYTTLMRFAQFFTSHSHQALIEYMFSARTQNRIRPQAPQWGIARPNMNDRRLSARFWFEEAR